MLFDADQPGRLVLREGGNVLAEYVYDSPRSAEESPRPYLLLRTRAGVEVTGHRPADHVWHSGLSLALPFVGAHNFWGGPTYVPGQGYRPLPNNGAQHHRAFAASDPSADDGVAEVEEELEWMSASGDVILVEQRRLTARLIDEQAWALTWRSVVRNVSGDTLAFGSPATNGRAGAGYGGLFWRGPTSFTGGGIVSADGPVGDDARGATGAWLSFIAPDRSAGVLVLDGEPSGGPWFARSGEYAGLGPAPFFHQERSLAAGQELEFSVAVVIGGPEVPTLAETVGASLRAEIRTPFREADA
jgi:hypothetical protein